MNKKQLSLKIFVVFIFINALVLTNPIRLFAQGQNAIESGSFEPIDATDMVNLSTGDFTYVLPLLNVQSPEGGYPLALSYHAGIAMDQEASWTGLGWNINAGAINRSVNGYPDDYKNSLLTEYFYDEGDEESFYSISLGYNDVSGASVGLGISWGSNRSLSGYVSVGYGFGIEGVGNAKLSYKAGTDGIGMNLGLTTNGGLSLGVNASTNGGLEGSIGFDSNGTGFSVSSSGSANISIAAPSGNENTMSLGISLSSNGIGLNASVKNKTGNNVDGGLGVGLQIMFENTLSMGDYTTRTSGWKIPFFIPTQSGILSLSFGKQKFRYYLGKNELNYVNGPIYFYEGTDNGSLWRVECEGEGYDTRPIGCGSYTTDDYQEALNVAASIEASSSVPDCHCDVYQVDIHEAFMDIYEVPLSNSEFSNSSQIDLNNAVFPSYDKYNVQAQGLSGSMSSRLFENGSLFGLADRENDKGYKLRYSIDGSTTDIPTFAQFNNRPYFYLDNEISTYLSMSDVNEANFNFNSTNNTILSYYSDGVDLNAKPRRRNATFIEYFTNKEIKENYSSVKSKGYLTPGSGFDINDTSLPENGISAFMITAVDGKTYHYSLPVHNHEIITRTFGAISARTNENQSYFEKRQLEPYATHWLLTAVTGPDYIDTNDNGFPDKGDYGYWVNFEYGKWSDAFVWKNPYGKDYLEGENDIKTWIRGRKEVYYLDKVKTRTHTAVFIKSEREDAKSVAWNYSSVDHVDNRDQDHNDFLSRFNIPSQKSLRLDKIILVREEDDTVNKSYGSTSQNYVDIIYNNSSKPSDQAWYNLKDGIIDIGDNWSGLVGDAIKVIDFNYDYSLVKGSPNTTSSTYGRLTLQSVEFKGKGGVKMIPSYNFDYINNITYSFNIEDKDSFGYYNDDNSMWSLNQIITPEGGKIQVNYEMHSINPVVKSNVKFSKGNAEFNIVLDSNTDGTIFTISSDHNLGIQIGDTMDLYYMESCVWEEGGNCGGPCGYEIEECEANLIATVIQNLGNNSFKIQVSNNGCYQYNPDTPYSCSFQSQTYYANYEVNNVINNFGGIRVNELITTDGENSYSTKYNYGENEDGVGVISYLPFAPELQEELPYSSELPSPRVMYEYVSMESMGSNNQSERKIQYKFKVLKEKDENDIKFGDLYEIDVITQEHINTVADKDVVISSYTVKDNLATLGQLLEVSNYNDEGQLLSKIDNTYYTPGETPNLFGVTKEAYQTYKIVDYIDNTLTLKDRWLVNSSARIKYPNLLKSSTEYKSGFDYTSRFGELDPVTGQANEIYFKGSDGSAYMTKIIPAYHKYPEMGTKVDNINNKNMLTQQTARFTYAAGEAAYSKVIGAGITTWNNEWSYRDSDGVESSPSNNKEKIWRKHKTYVWKGDVYEFDGSYIGFNIETDDGFNWGVNATQTNQKWTNVVTTTRYDHYSLPLESKDINDNYASTKMCDAESKLMATSNAKYTEMFYSGAEYITENTSYFDSEVKSYGRTDVKVHTGKYSVKVNTGQKAFEVNLKLGEHRSGKYKISVWVEKLKKANARIRINSSTKSFNGEEVYAGDWVMLNHYEDLSTGDENIYVTSSSGEIYFDDFRLLPVASNMISYVYNEWDELTYVIGANNMSTQYKYDDGGNLCKVYIEVADTPEITGGFKLIKHVKKNYQDFTPENCQCCDDEIGTDHQPVAVNDVGDINYLGKKSFNVLANDDFGGDGPASGTIEISTQPSAGTATINNNGTPTYPADDEIYYTPQAGYNGSVTITYKITDSDGDFTTAVLNINAVNIPQYSVYFDDIDNTESAFVIAKLYGIPGSTVTYNCTHDSGGGGVMFTVGDQLTDVYLATSSNKTVTIPSIGYVECNIELFAMPSEEALAYISIINTSEGTISPYSDLTAESF